MRLIVLTTNDSRQRWKFITDPWECSDKTANYIKWQGKSLTPLVKGTILIAKEKRQTKFVVFSTGPKNLLFAMIAYCMGVSVVFRVGGNPFLHSESLRIKNVTSLSFLRKNLRKYKKYIQAKLIARFSDLIIVVNNTTKKVLLNKAYKNVAVVPQYIKMTPTKSKKTYEQRNYNDDKNIVRFVTVTNLNSEEKARGVRLLIRLLHAWSQRNSKNIAFTIFGDGEHKGIVEEAAEEYRSGNYNVIDAGFVKSVQETIIEHDIFLYYSRVDTTCNAILEAMAGGLPVIVNADDNFKEYIEHKWNGLLFDEEDSFMEAVDYLYENERRRGDIGSKGRETIQMCFSLAAVQEKLTKVLG